MLLSDSLTRANARQVCRDAERCLSRRGGPIRALCTASKVSVLPRTQRSLLRTRLNALVLTHVPSPL